MKKRKNCVALLLVLFAVLFTAIRFADAQPNYFRNWPSGRSPKEIGKRLAENFVKRDFEFQSGKRQYVIYPEACTWYGALNVAEELKDKDLKTRLVHKFDRFLTPEGSKAISP